jgi:hydroxymethylbilane synthase
MLRKVTVRGPLAEAEDIGKKAAKEMEDYI